MSMDNDFGAIIASLDGARSPGGCDYCNAEHVVHAHRHGPNVHSVEIQHDDWCPWWKQRNAPSGTPS